ncbi:MAG: glycosyltransferase family 39 protein [Flavobacteriales bacterium]|nr:glycosyltransferase family 39 protein [Flavobacteriales bacterium]MBK6943802.1 glycosyltransferase family 39 protein [Flavobacteriales bacterium]MBP9138630.1 glycosyltransferase family 39 protein [Flavobacteriales bacterium]HQV51007.1 glycosyltransferase family 39 protein [Flavobacteriales bacterium]HQX28576.1 glycosyltransferase family 39 protein [Flavobacteriales bacterium]
MTQRSFHFAIAGIVLVTIAGAGLDVMEVDAAQYAGMSRDMLASDNWTKLYFRGHDYLDKPPLLFWLSALSFKLFGISNWSYKLPSILFAFLGLVATYRFTLLYSSREVARSASLMFGGSAAFLLMTNDVRCDTILTGSVMTAIWAGAAWIEQRRWWQLGLCAMAIGAGMLVKGPMGIMAPLLALIGHIAFAKRWDVFRDARWLIGILVIGILLIPMCIGLYEQHGIQGLRFYFWEQSFGRITGENRWKDDSSYFYFTHEVLWQMLPWTIFILVGILASVKEVVERTAREYFTISGIVLVFVAISLSHFKLPHYLYVILPLLAVLGARAWHSARSAWLFRTHGIVVILVWSLTVVLAAWSFPNGSVPFIALMLILVVVAVLILHRMADRSGLFLATFWIMMGIGITVNGHVYPQILHYQANAQAGKWAAENGYDRNHFFGMHLSGTALDLYAGFPVKWISNVGEANDVIGPGVAVYTDVIHREQLIQAGFRPKSEVVLQNYEVQLMGFDMIDPIKRYKAVEARFILIY